MREQNNKKYKMGYLLLIVVIPLSAFLVNLIVGWNTGISLKIVADDNTWVAFYASLIGAFLSGSLTLTGVYLTIKDRLKESDLESTPMKIEAIRVLIPILQDFNNVDIFNFNENLKDIEELISTYGDSKILRNANDKQERSILRSYLTAILHELKNKQSKFITNPRAYIFIQKNIANLEELIHMISEEDTEINRSLLSKISKSIKRMEDDLKMEEKYLIHHLEKGYLGYY